MVREWEQYPNGVEEAELLEKSFGFPLETPPIDETFLITSSIAAFVDKIIPNDEEFAQIMKTLKMS